MPIVPIVPIITTLVAAQASRSTAIAATAGAANGRSIRQAGNSSIIVPGSSYNSAGITEYGGGGGYSVATTKVWADRPASLWFWSV